MKLASYLRQPKIRNELNKKRISRQLALDGLSFFLSTTMNTSSLITIRLINMSVNMIVMDLDLVVVEEEVKEVAVVVTLTVNKKAKLKV